MVLQRAEAARFVKSSSVLVGRQYKQYRRCRTRCTQDERREDEEQGQHSARHICRTRLEG